MLVQGTPSVAAIAASGGFMTGVPKGTPLPTWEHTTVTAQPDYTLKGESGLVRRTVQIDCHGTKPADTILLGKAIDAVLSGYQGVLNDPDATYVHGCFQTNLIDFFDDADRSYRRMIEYEVLFMSK